MYHESSTGRRQVVSQVDVHEDEDGEEYDDDDDEDAEICEWLG
jgi:hypothetical protein